LVKSKGDKSIDYNKINKINKSKINS